MFTISIILSVIILSVYIVLILKFIAGWKLIPYFLAEEEISSAKIVSVVVACRNESLHLPQLISSLKNQTLSNFELILVNDHSVDNTLQLMQQAANEIETTTIINSIGTGKKAALSEGIRCASGSLIITTDADCEPSAHWIETIVAFQQSNECDLIICPVSMKSEKNLFTQLQSVEFASLVMSGAGAAGAKMPILCNGANLAFTKAAWVASQHDLQQNEISGDDVFLMLSIKKRNGKIRFLKSKKATVITQTVDTLDKFIHQRQRWTSKSKSYTDKHIIVTALSVFAISTFQLILLVATFIEQAYFPVFASVFLLKLGVDYSLLLNAKTFFDMKNVFVNSVLLSVVYPFYISFTAISGLIKQTQKW